MHPKQIAVINDVFSPTASEVASARHIVDAHSIAVGEHGGVFRLGNQMIDAPVVRRARQILERAAAMNSAPPSGKREAT